MYIQNLKKLQEEKNTGTNGAGISPEEAGLFLKKYALVSRIFRPGLRREITDQQRRAIKRVLERNEEYRGMEGKDKRGQVGKALEDVDRAIMAKREENSFGMDESDFEHFAKTLTETIMKTMNGKGA